MKEKVFDQKYAEYYEIFNSGKDYKKECDFLEEIFKKYKSASIKTILDLGCGTGAHEKYLSERGYFVTGLDISEAMIKLAMSKNIANCNFIVGDMADFDLKKKFDSCICMFSSLGYLTENKRIESALKSIKKSIVPGGLFVMDCWNGLGVLKSPPTSRVKSKENADIKIVRTSYPLLDAFNHSCKVKFEVEVFENNQLKESYTEDHNVRFFFPQEIKKYLEEQGFEILDICKLWEPGTAVNENDWNMAIIARLK